ncbi:MAG: TetR/AcrR family transcriptional regulator, partial [Clostridia bacterium]|nr:TetR/AcrR family transcriptional regulator [Clostridia bacterium]
MNKDEKLNITKEKLIKATVELMEKADDPFQVTSREIASAADTKPSMINYCFGSREELIYAAFHNLYLSFLDEANVEKIMKKKLPPKEFLKQIHFVVAKCLVKNYKFTKATTPLVLFKRDLSEESFSFKYVSEHFAGRRSEQECKLVAYELSTMMQLIIYRKDDIRR